MQTKEKAVLSSPKVVEVTKSQPIIYVTNKPVYDFFKRIFDILVAFVLLIVLFVPFLILSLIIVIDSPGASPIYWQDRVGKNGKIFKFFKFRSMVPNAENMLNELLDKNEMSGPVFKIKKDPRITRVGRFIRKTSIDELPQLINILKGDMSFIGPRPPLTYHPWPLEEYTPQQRRMFEVRPGITGWAQINGRKGVEWNRRIEMNVWYVDHVSFGLDMKILLATVGKVLSNADNENTGETVQKK